MNPIHFIVSIAAFARISFAAVNAINAVDAVTISDAVEEKKRIDAGLVDSTKCTKALEGIVYTPETCAYQYLARVSDQIKIQLPHIFTEISAGNLNVLSSVANAYQVTIYLTTPYGNPVQGDANIVALTNPFFDAAMARSYLNFDGFDSDNGAQTYNYQFQLMSQDAAVIMVRISLPWSKAPVGCNY